MERVEALVQWFVAKGGSIDQSAIGFKEFVDSSRGAVALRDINEGHTLFTIPRPLILSTRTCSLKEELGEKAWEGLGTGWTTLILCMMWEQMKGEHGNWSSYLAYLPSTFTTPMFWNESDFKELQATAIADKIGKDDAENDYRSRIVPLLSARPDLFPPEHRDTIFSLENFHRLGSNILSRSFHVEEWSDPSKVDESIDSDDDDEDDRQDTGDVAMIPMADMLNARFEHDNARLFYEELTVSMVTTKAIKAGDQIWNTYGDPPNSDLLRRYGHVDLVPLADGNMGNPADVVEVRADLAVQVYSDAGDLQERIDWWLEQGGDDVFVIEASEPEVPEGLISILKLLRLSTEEWAKTMSKNKPPKSSLDSPSATAALLLLDRRLAEYPTTLEEDEALLTQSGLSFNRRNAVIVRLGEKRILRKVLNSLRETLPTLANSEKKRGRTSDEVFVQKKARR